MRAEPEPRRRSDHVRRTRARGLSLTEIAVIVAVIAILIALLVPGLSRVRYQSRLTQCATTLRGFVTVLAQFANDNRGRLPTGDAAQGIAKPQNNLWDIPGSMLDDLTGRYALPRKNTVCPAVDYASFIAGADAVYNQSEQYRIQAVLGYGYWVPRTGTGVVGQDTVFPPPADRSNPFYEYAPDPTIKPQQGPRTLVDPIAARVPVLSDAVFADDTEDPAYPTKIPALGKGLDKYATHVWGDTVDAINKAYIDGRVERVKATELKATYNLKYYSPYWDGKYYPSWNWQ